MATPGGSSTLLLPGSTETVVVWMGAPSGITVSSARPSPAGIVATPASFAVRAMKSFSPWNRARRACDDGFPIGPITSISSSPRDPAPSAGSLSANGAGVIARVAVVSFDAGARCSGDGGAPALRRGRLKAGVLARGEQEPGDHAHDADGDRESDPAFRGAHGFSGIVIVSTRPGFT